MPGTKEGSQKRLETMKQRDPDYYKKMGKKGQAARKSHRGGFNELAENDPERHKEITDRGRRNRKSLTKKSKPVS